MFVGGLRRVRLSSSQEETLKKKCWPILEEHSSDSWYIAVYTLILISEALRHYNPAGKCCFKCQHVRLLTRFMFIAKALIRLMALAKSTVCDTRYNFEAFISTRVLHFFCENIFFSNFLFAARITSTISRIDRLQPRDKAAMLVVKTIKNFFAEFA